MRFYINLMMLFLISSSAIAESTNIQICPPMDTSSYLTKNNRGDSSYKGDGSEDNIKYMVENLGLDLSKPILDVGAGYGTFSYELIKLGAKQLYINELSTENLTCLKRNIEKSFSEKNLNINYLVGDISDTSVFRTVPNSSLNLVYAKNVIHFFSAPQIVDFFIKAHNGLEKNGLLYLVFENPYLKQQNDLMTSIDNIEHENQIKGSSISLDDIVVQQYNTFDMGANQAHCSAKDYINTPQSIRNPGFPCLIETVRNGEPYGYQLLKPEILAIILKNLGFNIIGANYQNDIHGSIVLIARKISN